MARLDMTARLRIGSALRDRLPAHWRVTVGDEGHAFIEVDQDGKRPDHEFHAIGSTVIVVTNGEKGLVQADRYERVKHPPGYLEGRKYHSEVAGVKGRGWADRVVEAITTAAAEADAKSFNLEVAEA